MSEWKVTASHRSRTAVIYVRQSTLLQVERNRESTARQYDLVSRARELGWPRTAVTVIDEDLGLSGASAAAGLGTVADRGDRRRSGRVGRDGRCPGGIRRAGHRGRAWAGRDRAGLEVSRLARTTAGTGTSCWVRHEALRIRAEMEGLRRRAVAAAW